MNEISKQKAIKNNDSRLWTALDCLEDLVSEIKAGNISPDQLVVHWFEFNDKDKPEDGRSHFYQASGVTYPDHIVLLNVALNRILNSWSDV